MFSRNRIFALAFAVSTLLTGVAHANPPNVMDDSVAFEGAGRVTLAERRALRRQLAARRQLMIRRLAAYSRAGVFPDNHVQPGQLNVFIDDEGHICAAANLIARDGHMDLVVAQAQADNFIRLADVHEGALYDWMLRSGLTQEEIAEIQEPYFMVDPELPPPVQQSLEQVEARRLQAHFAAVLRDLRRSTRVSLDIAVDRLIATM